MQRLVGGWIVGVSRNEGLMEGPVIVSLIVAVDEDWGIGLDNRIPWHLSSDVKRFKALTMGHALIMGRKTYQSIGRPLPGRLNIILTHQPNFQAPGCRVAGALSDALSLAQAHGSGEVFIIGGSLIYQQALPVADRIYLTQVHARVGADVFFPDWDEANWHEVERSEHPAGEKDQYGYTYRVLEKCRLVQNG